MGLNLHLNSTKSPRSSRLIPEKQYSKEHHPINTSTSFGEFRSSEVPFNSNQEQHRANVCQAQNNFNQKVEILDRSAVYRENREGSSKEADGEAIFGEKGI